MVSINALRAKKASVEEGGGARTAVLAISLRAKLALHVKKKKGAA